jgi:predicted TIM-barrel fold metal-dependent hydrolase
MAIIDAHTHYYPEAIFSEPRAWAMERGETHWADCVAPVDTPTIQGWADIDKMLADMDAADIEKAVLLGWYWQHHQTCTEQNQWYAQVLRQHPDRFIAFATLNATANEAAIDTINWAKDQGFHGIGEIHPQVQGHTLRDPCWQDIMEATIAADLPINLHVTEPVGRDYPTKVETPLQDYLWLAKNYPEATLILAHWGGLLPFFEQNPAVKKQLTNVYYDTAASPLLYAPSIFRNILNTIGHDRILYGSDYPLRLYPKTQPSPDFRPFLADINNQDLNPTEKQAILYNNTAQLLKLQHTPS